MRLRPVSLAAALPQPDGPMRATSDWGGTTPLTPLRMVAFPPFFLSFSPMFSNEMLAGVTRFCDSLSLPRNSAANSPSTSSWYGAV